MRNEKVVKIEYISALSALTQSFMCISIVYLIVDTVCGIFFWCVDCKSY